MKDNCDHCLSSESELGFLFSNQDWRVFLTEEQSYLGRCIVELKTHKESLSDLSNEEWLSFGNICRQVEATLKKTFEADLFNWTCLMNNSYQKEKPTPHVHWHLRPRYRNKVTFASLEFADPDFGHHYDRERRDKVTPKVFGEIVNKIKSKL